MCTSFIKKENDNCIIAMNFDRIHILNEVKQSGEWKTELSLVYNQNEGIIYYCENQNFKEIKQFEFE